MMRSPNDTTESRRRSVMMSVNTSRPGDPSPLRAGYEKRWAKLRIRTFTFPISSSITIWDGLR